MNEEIQRQRLVALQAFEQLTQDKAEVSKKLLNTTKALKALDDALLNEGRK